MNKYLQTRIRFSIKSFDLYRCEQRLYFVPDDLIIYCRGGSLRPPENIVFLQQRDRFVKLYPTSKYLYYCVVGDGASTSR